MTHSRSAFTCVAAVLACGCVSFVEPTPRDPGLELPAAYTAHEQAAEPPAGPPPEEWWRELGSAELAQTVEEALAFNRDLGATAARLEAAVARADVAGADLWPQLAARLDDSRRRQNFVGLPIPGSDGVLSTTFNQHVLALDLSWELDLWGRIRAGELAAEADVEAAAADLRGARLSIAARAAKAWLRVVEAGQQLELADATAANFARTEALIEERFQAGVRSALDLRLARTDRVQAEALVQQRRRELDRAIRDLETLCGGYPDGVRPVAAELPQMPPPVPTGLPATLLERRPDLVAADRRLAARDARLGEARAALLPRLTLTASGGTTSDDVRDLVDLDFRVWSLASGVFAPLFQGGRLRANVAARDAERREALANWAEAVLQALREVEQALAAEQFLASEVERLGVAAEEARAARDLSEDRYRRGLIDVITLSSAQRRALAAETEWLRARRARLDTRVDLLLALGGGFSPPADTPPSTAAAEAP